ncbi:DUF742 domain-containing protein [Streptomyces chartreusis]|uniref:DUF742 domain-containing protein n=1 Tax=Streptomyces chartreusis TaxID=1969 RepID=UPI0036A5B9C2
MTQGPARRLVPSYLATGGVHTPEHKTLEELTALTATGRPALPHHTPAHQRLLDLLSDGGLTVMEIAGYLRLPVGVVKMLAAQLMSDGHLRTAAPLPHGLAPTTNAGRPSRALLEEVMHGLLAL